jgi:FkbM family methyltransferase
MALPSSIISFLEKNPISVHDVGARNGFHDFPQLEKWMEVHAYEADPEEAEHLQKTNHPFKSFLVHPVALSGTDGKRKFHLTKRRSFSSFLEFDEKEFEKYFGRMKDAEEWKKYFEIERSVEISTTTLDLLLTGNSVIDFLKLDTQGTEREILQGGKKLLENKQISLIETEVNMQPVYKGQPAFSILDVFLRDKGFLLVDYRINQNAFSPVKINNPLQENIRMANGGDAVYILDMNLLPENERSDRAVKSALLLAHKGYLSVADYLLKTFTKISEEEINTIFETLNSVSAQEKRKNFARKWIPPGLIEPFK